MQLITRSDFDGLICATLLRHLGVIHAYRFVHPKDIQDGKYQPTPDDVLANVPYVPGCGLWFDHHSSEQTRLGTDLRFAGRYAQAPSCARVIWDYYGGHAAFPASFDEMMEAVDKCDSGQLSAEEIARPDGWVLLNFVMDPRTGLGRYRDYRISNYQLMEELVEYCRTLPIAQILSLPDIQERVRRYWAQDALYRRMIEANSTQQGHVVVDLRQQDEIYAGNRFVLYTLYPSANISLLAMQGLRRQNVVITCGHSIVNRTSTVDVGAVMLRHGGGGHRMVGTCQVPHERADGVIAELVTELNQAA